MLPSVFDCMYRIYFLIISHQYFTRKILTYYKHEILKFIIVYLGYAILKTPN